MQQERVSEQTHLHRRWRPALMAFFLRRVRDHNEAEDLTQEVFLRLLNVGAHAQSPDAYVFQVAANLVTDRARRVRVRAEYREAASRQDDRHVEPIDPHRILAARAQLAAMTRALESLPERTRTIFTLYRIENMSQQMIGLGCDRAIVTMTDTNAKVTRFAQQQKVALLTAAFLRHWAGGDDVLKDRLSLEELIASIQSYAWQKQDGDWIKQIAVAKSAVVCLAPYPAFNKAISSFRFFAERAATRPQHREQALRGAFLSAALACMALDAALEKLAFEEHSTLDVCRRRQSGREGGGSGWA
ncbi:RNA polymerase sigma factor [Sphingomonas hengshuiensis]|uniref:RNA polymerase sigma factor n=1 Tax=Sphingomonas hengshuiensis TaxID=1609977 RepID=UPI000A823D12|nr:sigma-70 family RNA polymerase sigma factor [Sphingomonas hengshuiensis]